MEPFRAERTVHSVTVDSGDSKDWAPALTGNGEAFGRIFDRHVGQVRRHSRRLVSEPADAEDVVAITFMEAWRNRARVRVVNDSVLPWLLVTATNVAHNTNRSSRRYRSFLASLPVPEPAPDSFSEHGSAEATQALAQLSLAHRTVVVLCIVEGLSEREAAAVLAVPQGTVKSRLSRAKERLRGQLTEPNITGPFYKEAES